MTIIESLAADLLESEDHLAGLERLKPLLTPEAFLDLAAAIEVCPVHLCDEQICRDDEADCQQPRPRTYALGVPVAITVHPNGRVDFDVDLSEVPLDESDCEPSYDDDAVAEDQAVVDTLLLAVRNHLSVSL